MTRINVSMNPYMYNASLGNGTLFVPVEPAQLIYAQFNKVAGVAAMQGQTGVPLSKVHLLNSLINNLNSVSREKIAKVTPQKTSEKDMEALIAKIHTELKQKMNKRPEADFILSGAKPMNGQVLSMMV